MIFICLQGSKSVIVYKNQFGKEIRLIYEVSPWDDGNHPVRSNVFVPELSVLVGQLHVYTFS